MERLGARLRLVAPIVAASVGVAILVIAAASLTRSLGFGYDFEAYDGAARRIADGSPLYLADTAARYRDGLYEGLYLYPPPLAVALVPLTVFSASDATHIWLVLRLVLFVGGCLALPVSRTTRLLVLAVGSVAFPVLFDLNLGNVSIVTFALCAIAWRTAGGPVAAVAHAALVAVRFTFGIFFVTWLLERRLGPILLTTVAGLALFALSLPFVGFGTYLDYLALLRGLPDITAGEHNLSLKSTALALGLPDGPAGLAVVLGYVAGLAAIAFSTRRRDLDTTFVVTATATLVVTPFIHPHYLVLLLLPAALLVDQGRVWGLGLPLLGWLPGEVLPLAGPLAIGAVLAMGPRRTVELASPSLRTTGALVP